MRIWAIALLFASWTPCWAEVTIEKPNRVPNRGYGVCAWCAIEMAGRQGDVSAVRGLAEYRDKESKRRVKQLRYSWNSSNGWIYESVDVEQKNNGGTIERMREQLDQLGVKYVCQPEGNRNRKILFEGTRDDSTGCIVGVFNYAYTYTGKKKDGCLVYQRPKADKKLGYHALLLTHIDNDVVKFIDPNDVRDPWVASRKWFDEHWDGSGMIITPLRDPRKSDTVVAEATPAPSPQPAKTTKPIEEQPRWVQVLIQSGMSERDAILTWNRMQGKEQ